MRIFKRRPSTVGAVLVSAAAVALLVLPASPASAATFPNACKNGITANNSQIGVTMTADLPASVAPGASFTLSNIDQSADVPGSIFVAGYNLGLLVVGPNVVPATVVTTIEGTNTVEGTQDTNTAATSISTTISDPNGVPGSGDESATDGTLSASYADQTWTAGASGTIEFREDTVTPVSGSPPPGFAGGIRIDGLIAGFLHARFGCSPGTVAPDPAPVGTITFDDPGATFASTDIVTEPVNQAPTADADGDQTVDQGDLVTLDGTGSSDPDPGDTLDYSWTQTSGTAVSLSGANTATPSFTAPAGPATLVFELTVCDQEPLCDTDSVTVTVNEAPPVNQAPTADADGDQTVDQGDLVTLDGTGSSDPDPGDTLDYSWTQTSGTAVSLSGANTATPSFTAPAGPATLVFELTVCDQEPLCDTDSVTVTVNEAPPVNQAPTADADGDQTVDQGDLVTLDGTGSSDPDPGDTLDYSWTQTSGTAVSLSGANTATPSFTAPAGPATLVFELTVCDQEPLCDTDSVTVTVNEAPVEGVDVSVDQVNPKGPVRSRGTQRVFAVWVKNLGTEKVTVCAEDVEATVAVNGVPSTGTIEALTGCKTIRPNRRQDFNFRWHYNPPTLLRGDEVVFTGCVNVAGDENSSNDCGSSATAIAK